MSIPPRWRRLLVIATPFLATAGILLTATQWVPDFYQQQAVIDTGRLQRTGQELEQRMFDLHTALQTEGRWQVAVSDEQINGWLAVSLRKKFPRLLPLYASQPRIQIAPDEARVACRYDNGQMSAVLSMSIEAFTTDRPNRIGIRIRDARVGAVPGLTATAMEQITCAARRSRIRLYWLPQHREPTAIVEIPTNLLNGNQRVTVEQIDFRAGQLLLAGRTVSGLPGKPRPQVLPRTPQPIRTTAVLPKSAPDMSAGSDQCILVVDRPET